MTSLEPSQTFDLQDAVADNRLAGLWRMMTGFRLVYITAAVTLGLAATVKTATYLLLRFLIDDVLGQERFAWLPLVALGFVGLALFEGAFTFLSGRLAAQTSEGIALRLRNYLFDHIQRLSFSYHDKTKTGELIQRVTSDVDAVRRFFAQEAIGFGRIVLLFTINFVAIFNLNRQLALVSVIIVPIIVVISYLFFTRISKAYEAYQEQDAILSTTLQENLSGVRVVKAFARQDYERDKFGRENWERFGRGKRLLLWHTLYWPVAEILAGLQMVGGYFVASVMVINGNISLGTYLAYAGMVIWIIWPMRILGRMIVQMSQALVSYDRVMEIIRQDREPLTAGAYAPPGGVRGDIVFDDVCFEYEGNLPVLRHISFHCRPGQRIALLGYTGSGKTSLVNLLPRFYEVSSGRLLLDGVEIHHYPRKYLRQQIGIVEQEPFLFSRTIRENIAYGAGRPVTQEEVVAAAKAAAIHDVIISFPDGYNTLVGERGVTLSGGQKQRVAIARTLLKNPRILILDDATSSVDTETEAAIRGALERLMEGRTTFIIAHRIQTVMNADLILVLDKGRIVQHGAHEELLAQPGIYREIYQLQARIEDELQEEIGELVTV
ncbi:MAG: ABC transporter ATP-binding protein/permease [Chloroflexi bacterium]|nr:ABC transporter ATP-binding protein/permease [Chloroflexota bacterium]MCI0579438.1 ABC transporter ATP-binding protein/permease [Chloroflexota bacterium]MCI0644985.1 ABC transporter ATP-binding protein/permease [Chloroflexota bacterium]MCI0732175.1 ABC transporter ATP-binding protein/permease [Chloroflexota bacterium]